MRLKHCCSLFLALLVLIMAPGAVTAAPLVIMVDPGHHLDAPGATSCSGIPEYQFNQKLAEVVIRRLRAAGYQVHSTADIPGPLRPRERAKRAAQADLLLSLHHDSVQPEAGNRMPGGGFCSRAANGFSLFVRQGGGAEPLAILIGQGLLQRGMVFNTYHAHVHRHEGYPILSSQAGLYAGGRLELLQSSTVPAILIEAAVIVHPDDERLAASPAYQSAYAEVITESLSRCRRAAVPLRGLVCDGQVPE